MDAEIDPNGDFKFSDRMRNKIYDTEEEFRSKIILEVNSAIENRWHVRFIETPQSTFMIDIFHETNDDYHIIKRIILERLNRDLISDFYSKRFDINLFRIV